MRASLDQLIFDQIEKGKLQAIIARSADFYGNVKERSLLMELVYKNLSQNKKANWFCNAKVKHSFTYIPDAGKATALLGNTPDAYNQVWNLPTDPDNLTGEEWINLFAQEMGKAPKYMVLPKMMVRILGLFLPVMKEFPEMMYQYDREYIFDSSKFGKRFAVKPTSYQDGVKETLRVMRDA